MYSAVLTKEPTVELIAKLIIIYYVISPFLYLVRTLAGDTGLAAVFLRVSQPVLMVFTLLACFFQNKLKLNAYSFTFLLVGFYGVVVAMLQDNKIVDITAGYLHFMTGVMLFIYFSNARTHIALDRFMRALTYTTVFSNAVVLSIIYSAYFLLGIHIYLGLACQILIVVFFYTTQQRKFIWSILSLFLIIISGKRGVFLALCSGITVAFLFSLSRLHIKKAIQTLLAILVVISLIVALLPMANEKLLNKYTYSQKETVDDYSAGRWNEVISAYTWWTSSLENIIIGSGFGFTYTYMHSTRKKADVEDYKNVHFSYINPLIILGIPVTLIYFICLLLIFFRILRVPSAHIKYLKLACLTYAIYACFVFDLFDEPIFWMINGILFGYSKQPATLSNLEHVTLGSA